MTGIIGVLRQRREADRQRRSVEHLDRRLLRDTGLEAFASPRLAKPFWWLRSG